MTLFVFQASDKLMRYFIFTALFQNMRHWSTQKALVMPSGATQKNKIFFSSSQEQPFKDRKTMITFSPGIPNLAPSTPLQSTRFQGPSPSHLLYICPGLSMWPLQCPVPFAVAYHRQQSQSMRDCCVLSSLFLYLVL